jgi:hypothetical protein
MRHRRTIGAGAGIGLAWLALTSACASPPSVPVDEIPPSEVVVDAALPDAAEVPSDGEELAFAIDLAGLPVGHATLTTRHGDADQPASDPDELRLEVKGETNALVDLFCAVHGVVRSRLEPDGRSKSFYLWVDEDGKASERALAFDAIPCLYYHVAGQDPWVASLTQYEAPRDPLALLHALRRLSPRDAPRDFEVAMTLRSFCYRARFLGREDVEVGAGTFEAALRWRVEVRPYRELGPAGADVGPIVGFYEVTLSADERRLPLRVARAFGFGTVALELNHVGPAAHEAALVTVSAASAPVR